MTRQRLISLFKILISCGLLYLLISRIGLEKILAQIGDFNLWYCAIAILFLLLSNLLGSVQWHLLLSSRGVHLPLWRTISFYFVGLFFNNFLIGYIGGDAIRIYDVSRISGDSSNSVSTVFFDRFIGLLTLITMALVFSIVWAKTLGSNKIILAVMGIFLLWVAALVVLFNKKLARFFATSLLNVLSPPVRQKGSEIYNGINAFRYDKSRLAQLAGLSVLIQTLRVIVHLFSALAVGVKASFIYFFIFVPVIALAASLPISIGGLGVREQTAVILFSRVGIAQAETILFQFLAYVIGIVVTIPGGIIFMLRKEQARHHRISAVDSANSGNI